MTEYALLRNGEIINVVTTSGGMEAAERVAERCEDDVTVVPLDSLPDDVKQRYQYWNERP